MQKNVDRLVQRSVLGEASYCLRIKRPGKDIQ